MMLRRDLEKQYERFRDALPADLRDAFEEFVGTIENDCDEAQDALNDAKEKHVEAVRILEDALVAASRRLHEAAYLNKPITDPEPLLRTVERALEDAL